MKYKFLLLFAAGTLILNSCDSDRDDQPTEKVLLLSKITAKYYSSYGEDTDVTSFIYNDKAQLITIDEGGDSRLNFTYDNEGKPIKATIYSGNTIEAVQAYTYEGRQLSKANTTSGSQLIDNTFYSYDNAGKLQSIKVCETPNCSAPYTDSFTYTGDNVTTELYTSSFNSMYKNDYTYNTSPSPYTYMNPYIRLLHGDAETISKNTYVTSKPSYKMSGGTTWESSPAYTYTYQYNEQGLPVERIGKDASGKVDSKTVYEYIIK